MFQLTNELDYYRVYLLLKFINLIYFINIKRTQNREKKEKKHKPVALGKLIILHFPTILIQPSILNPLRLYSKLQRVLIINGYNCSVSLFVKPAPAWQRVAIKFPCFCFYKQTYLIKKFLQIAQG